MKKFAFLLALALGFLFVVPAQAEEKDMLRKGVDRRYRLSKKLQSEININGGDFLGDETHNSWSVGAKYFLHINNTIAVGASYMYTPIYTDFDSTFGKTVKSRQQHFIDGEVMFSNDAALRAGNSVIEFDLFGTLGMGTEWINRHWEPVGVIGGGIIVYTPWPWFAARVDVTNYIHPTPNPSGDTINADINFAAGVSFFFPVKRINEEGGPVLSP